MAGAIVSASTGVLSTLLPKLSALIEGEYKLQKGVKRKINFLKDELASMQTLLVKLADKEETLDVLAKDWRNKVRELSYDIEDCIDLFMYKMSRGDVEANLIKKTASKIKNIWSRHKIDSLIEELKARVQEESDRRERYKFDDPATTSSQVVQIDPRLPALYIEAQRLVGIDGPREKIIEWLEVDNGQQLKVVSIVGFGGLGKTTLANQVYQKINGQFDCSCFVPVSRNPNIVKILSDMLKDLSKKKGMHKELGICIDPSDDERRLIDKLRSFLQDKRYFIIVDDIWSTEAWELVKSALPENNLNSRIITTTRIDSVAESCSSSLTGYVHNIKPLSDQQSHQLFFKRLGDPSARPLQLEEMSHRILKKCHGLPLAIITVASLLAGKSDKDQWERVCNSMGFAFSHRGMRDILLLSYYDLPRHLKTCLLYLSMFPEDFMIRREELIWRWIAEGFVAEVRGQTVDQVAESYLNELINRSLIQPIDIQYDGTVEFCRVHDIVLELIVSLSVQENFASIAEEQSFNDGDLKIRRLSVQSEHLGDALIQKIMDKWSQIRSISLYRLQELRISHLEKLHSLRVLVFNGGCHLGNQHVKYIGSFFQLTFLGINAKDITELPEDVGDLRYLQTLDIRGSGIKKLPTSIGRLQNLMRLLVDLDVDLPNKIGDLQTLQELSLAQNYSIFFLEELGRLTRLKTVGISVARDREQFGSDVGRYKEALKLCLTAMNEHGLQSLQINNGSILQELMDILCCTVPCLRKLHICGFRINKSLPKQMASFANLTHLALMLVRIKQEDLYVLGEVPSLLYMQLHVDHSPDERLTISSQQFRYLKEFVFFTYEYGGGLEMLFLQEAMPELRRLHLTFRAQETETGFEFCFKHLASLEHLSVSIRRDNATRNRMEAAEAAVRNAVSIHPGCPTLDLSFFAL